MEGSLQVQVNDTSIGMPIPDAIVKIKDAAGKQIEELKTDESGQTPEIKLPCPPIDYSQEPNQPQPYAQYNIEVDAEEFEPVNVMGTQLFADELAIQNVNTNSVTMIKIGPNTLNGDYPPKIPEAAEKPLTGPTGYVVLDKVVVPEYIVVHEGVPTANTRNYYVLFKDYVKNVACSEIYSTWPVTTIRANVLAIISFTLNRVFTEWYRNKGYNFTVTSSTAYDHAFIYGRNIFQSISKIVDEIFSTYITKPAILQPLLAQYCDGIRVSCPNWMSQWGSKYLGDKGYTPINILRYYYGQNVYLEQAPKVVGVPSSFPGTNLQVGSRGPNVRTIQSQLNAISKNYPAIPKLVVDGIYGNATKNAVQTFQRIFFLPQSGIVDFPTWYKISGIYVAVQKLAQL